MRTLIFALSVSMSLVGICRADDKATDIVKKAIDAHGGAEALNKYKAGRFNMTGEMTIFGMDLKFTGKMAYVTPDKYKMELVTKVQGMQMEINQIANGKSTKSSVKLNGERQPVGGDNDAEELKFSAALQEIGQMTPLLDAKRFEIKAIDDGEFGGVKYSGVQVKVIALKRDCKLYFDKKTGLQVVTVHTAKSVGENGAAEEVLEESTNSDFKKINGLMIAGKLSVKHDGKKFMEIVCKDIEVLENIDNKEFAIDD